MTSLFESWNGEVLCKKVSLIDAGPSVEEQTILFIEAQDRMKKRPNVEDRAFLIMEAQDHIKKRPYLKDAYSVSKTRFQAHDQRFEAWNEEVLCKNVSLIDVGPGVEEQTILFMEAQDRPSVEERVILFMEAQDCVKKKPYFKMRNSSSKTPFQAHDQTIRSLERGSQSVKEQAILFKEAQDRMEKRPLFKIA
ncbi:hypothetical protein Tco_0687882 [Tanacetum coccineum]